MGFLITDNLFAANMGVMYNGGYTPGSGGISQTPANTVAYRQTQRSPMNMDGYHIDDSNLIQMINMDGDKLELGEVEIKIHNAPVFTEENYRITEEKAALEKKYGVYGMVFTDCNTEYMRETYGQLNFANMDKLILSAHAKAEGIDENKCKMIFNTDDLAKKAYTFFQTTGSFFGDLEYFKFSEEDLDAVAKLQAEMDNIFNELVSNIKSGKGESIQALESKLTIKGCEVTLGEVMDIRDGFNSVNYMSSGRVSESFMAFANNDAVSGLAKSYFNTYVNECLEGDAAKLANQTYDAYLKDDIKAADVPIPGAVLPGDEYIHPNTTFTGTHREDIFNILANMDTSSEEAFKSGISDAINKAIDFEYGIFRRCGAPDSIAKGWTDTTRMWLEEAVARMKPMDQIRTVR